MYEMITDCFAASSSHNPAHNSDSHGATLHFILIVGRVIKIFREGNTYGT